MNDYAEDIYESYIFRNSAKRLYMILDHKYTTSDSNKVMKNQCHDSTEKNVMIYLNYYKHLRSCSMEHLVLRKQIYLSFNSRSMQSQYVQYHIQSQRYTKK